MNHQIQMGHVGFGPMGNEALGNALREQAMKVKAAERLDSVGAYYAKQAPRTPEIQEQLDRLDKKLNACIEAFSRLSEKLEPTVARPAPPENAAAIPMVAAVQATAIGSRIAQFCGELEALQSRIASLAERVEV